MNVHYKVRQAVTLAVVLALSLTGIVACSSDAPSRTLTGRPTAPSPLTIRERVASVWTGTEVMVFGGQQGWKTDVTSVGRAAAYEPDGDVWRTLPDSPILDRRGAVAVILDEQVLVWGGEADCGRDSCPSLASGARFDLAANVWTAQEPGTGAIGLSDATAVVACDHAYFGAGGVGDGAARTDFIVTTGSAGSTWETIRFGDPVYDLTANDWGVLVLTLNAQGKLTLHVLDACSGEKQFTVPFADPEPTVGVWLEPVDDRVWLGQETEQGRTTIWSLSDPRSGWRAVETTSPQDMSMANSTRDLRPGWTEVHGTVIYGVTPLGKWSYDTSTNKVTRLNTEPEICGASAATVIADDHLFIWGGQKCSSVGDLQSNAGIWVPL